MFEILLVLLFVNLTCSSAEYVFQRPSDYILCRNCGNPLLRSDKLISKASSSALYSFNETLFNTKNVLVQVLHTDLFFQFPVITSSKSTCVATGEYEEEELWFPDYIWKPCFCAMCGNFVGWMFLNHNPEEGRTHRFFGHILTNIISENFTNSLITYPNNIF